MATIPIYDTTTLPRMTLPMINSQKSTKKYLGGIAVTSALEVNLNTIAVTDTEAKALYDFWENDLKSGLEPFLVDLPIFGNASTPETPSLLVKFIGDFSMTMDGNLWTAKHRLKIFGTIDYIIDEFGDFIVSDTGEYTITEGGDYVPTGNVINAYSSLKEVIVWG